MIEKISYYNFVCFLLNELDVLNLWQELSSKGRVLLLAQVVMRLDVSPLVTVSSSIVAAVSRLKSKVLSIVSPTGSGIFGCSYCLRLCKFAENS